MKIQTFTIIAGTTLCNANCPYCISKMTPKQGMNIKEPKINWRNFDKACRLAQLSGATNVIISGKGEPTLYPEQVTEFLRYMQNFNFPIIEMQTNGILLAKPEFDKYLTKWYNLGLTIIAISTVHYNQDKNKQIFSEDYPDLKQLVNKLHKIGFTVRLSCTMIKGFIDSVEEAVKMIKKAQELQVEQLSLRELAKPLESSGPSILEWVNTNTPDYTEIKDFIAKNSHKLLNMGHGSSIYDFQGQNVCLTNALTLEPENDTLRQIIFFPDGKVRFDWQFQGAILI